MISITHLKYEFSIIEIDFSLNILGFEACTNIPPYMHCEIASIYLIVSECENAAYCYAFDGIEISNSNGIPGEIKLCSVNGCGIGILDFQLIMPCLGGKRCLGTIIR